MVALQEVYLLLRALVSPDRLEGTLRRSHFNSVHAFLQFYRHLLIRCWVGKGVLRSIACGLCRRFAGGAHRRVLINRQRRHSWSLHIALSFLPEEVTCLEAFRNNRPLISCGNNLLLYQLLWSAPDPTQLLGKTLLRRFSSGRKADEGLRRSELLQILSLERLCCQVFQTLVAQRLQLLRLLD